MNGHGAYGDLLDKKHQKCIIYAMNLKESKRILKWMIKCLGQSILSKDELRLEVKEKMSFLTIMMCRYVRTKEFVLLFSKTL